MVKNLTAILYLSKIPQSKLAPIHDWELILRECGDLFAKVTPVHTPNSYVDAFLKSVFNTSSIKKRSLSFSPFLDPGHDHIICSDQYSLFVNVCKGKDKNCCFYCFGCICTPEIIMGTILS